MNTGYVNDDDKYKQHSQSYYDSNFYEDEGVIRRIAKNAREDDKGCEENPLKRHLELIKVVKHFLDKDFVKLKLNELEGDKEPTYNYEQRETYCICGENSTLYKCEHLETGISFYMGSRCITYFHPDFEPANDNGVCTECNDKLRVKGNKKKGKVKNYDKGSIKICFICLKNRLKNKRDLYVMRNMFNIYKNEMEKEKIIRLEIEEEQKQLKKIEEEKKKRLEEERHIKILRLMRHNIEYNLKHRW